MKQRLKSLLGGLRTPAQFTRARQARGDTRQRAINWLDKDKAAAPTPEAAQPAAPTGQAPARAALARAPRKRERRRAHQPDTTLHHLLATDAKSQKYAEQLWWKFTHYYLPAKRLDIQRRRGLAASGTLPDDEALVEHE
jgi:hypothetical protein